MAKKPESISYVKIGNVEHPIDAVTVNGMTIPDTSHLLPSLSNEDEGKILMVLQGQWTLYDPSGLYDEINGTDCGDPEPVIIYEESYLTLDILDTGTIKWNAFGSDSAKTIQYSINDGEWTSITSTAAGATINVTAGDKMRLKGTNNSYAIQSNENLSGFGGKTSQASTGTASFNVYGNIMSLIYGDNFINQTTLPSGSSYNFCSLFDGSNVVSAEHLILPAMTLRPHCYRALLANCPLLTTPPVLPATTLSESCYRYMFNMDVSMTTTPELPALVVPDSAYYGLFNGCSSVNYIKCLARDISAHYATQNWVQGVANSGTFVKDVNMTDWKVNNIHGIPNGWTPESEGTVINVTSPTISFENNTITLSCSESGTTIYYRLGTSGDFAVYSTPIEISETVRVYAYARNNTSYVNSSTVNMNCQYVAPLEVAAPVISCTNNTVTITCSTTGATIYYKLGENGSYQTYTTPIEINDDVTVYAYASLSGTDSTVVSENCTYVEPYEPGDSDSDSDYGESESEGGEIITVSAPVISYTNNTLTITCDTPGATIYYRLGDSGQYTVYSAPVSLSETTDVYAYASVDGVTSTTVSETCTYDYSLDYLTFDILTSGTILWDAEGSNATKTIEYSINDGAWTSVTSTTSGAAINVTAGDSVRFRGSNTQYCNANKSNYSRFGAGTATFNISGNIMSMTNGDNFAGVTTLPAAWTFTQFFKESKPVSAENLILPATTMLESCYRALFSKCTTLVTPPALPATTLASYCYYYMFENCAITTAPDLLAATIPSYGYAYMFTGCSSLNYIKCMATTKSASSCLTNWVNNVASSGTFVKDSNTIWTLNSASGIPTGWTVFDNEIIEDPVITFNGEDKITITCDTSGADIYYRLGTTGNYSLYSNVIVINADTTVYAYSSKDGQQSNTVSLECTYSEHIYTYDGLKIASGPLYYGSNGYEIKDSWDYSSYNSVYGKSVGSYYFNYLEMGELFEKSGFSTSDGDIENILDPLDGWRLPSDSEWEALVGTTRTGSTVNNSSNKHYALIQLTGVTYAGSSTPNGLLIFPDGETITGATLSNMDNSTVNTSITESQLNEYISQGCIFLPAGGHYSGSWSSGGDGVFYGGSTEYNASNGFNLYNNTVSNVGKSSDYQMVILVKNNTYGDESPFEGANKDINNWNI